MVDFEGLAEHLLEAGAAPFALLSNQSTPTTAFLHGRFKGQLAALFSPEHGFFASAAAGSRTPSTWHPFWNVPVHSLYGETRKPTPEMLDGIGRIVIDLPDIAVRCYTYLATIKLTLESAAEAGIPVTVLDRPIPLGGVLDGPTRHDPAFASFVAPLDIPLCHGMTPGEEATGIKNAEGLDLDLTVVRMRGWSHLNRDPWPGFVPPSPAIRSWDSAVMYPATVFTEAYPAIDCDRSGPLAFRVVGAPWIDACDLVAKLAKPLAVCGVDVRPYRYAPSGGQYQGRHLDGVLLSVRNPSAFYPVTAGVLIFAAIVSRHGEKAMHGARPEWLDKLTGSAAVNEALRRGEFGELFQSWIEEQDDFLPGRVNLY